MPSQRSATGMGLLALVFWTTSVAVVRQLVAQIGPLTYLAVTSLAAGLLLATVQAVRRRRWSACLLFPRKYLLGGGACFVGYFVLFATAHALAPDHATAVRLALVNYLWPPLVLLLSVPLLGCRARWPMLLAGVALAVIGAAAGTLREAGPAGFLRSVAASPAAFGLMLLAAGAWGAYSNLARRDHVEGSASGVPVFLLATGVLAGAARGVLGEASRWDGALTVPLIYACVFPSAVAYSLWEAGMRRGSVPVLAAASYLLPLGSVLFACWYLGVPPTGNLLAGAALVVAGAVLSRLGIRPPADSEKLPA